MLAQQGFILGRLLDDLGVTMLVLWPAGLVALVSIAVSMKSHYSGGLVSTRFPPQPG